MCSYGLIFAPYFFFFIYNLKASQPLHIFDCLKWDEHWLTSYNLMFDSKLLYMESFFTSSQKVIVIEIFKPQFKLLDGLRETKLWSFLIFVTSVLETRGVVSVIATMSVVNVIYHLFHFIFLFFSRNSALGDSFIVKCAWSSSLLGLEIYG